MQLCSSQVRKKREQVVNKKIAFSILINIFTLNSELHTLNGKETAHFVF